MGALQVQIELAVVATMATLFTVAVVKVRWTIGRLRADQHSYLRKLAKYIDRLKEREV